MTSTKHINGGLKLKNNHSVSLKGAPSKIGYGATINGKYYRINKEDIDLIKYLDHDLPVQCINIKELIYIVGSLLCVIAVIYL